MSTALVSGLEAAGYEVIAASSAEEGFFLVHTLRPDLLLLDLTLPQRNGLDILRQIRKEGMDLRVLILTSHNTVEDRVEGLRTGADDYLGKPFSFPELTARIDALLRRFLTPPPSAVVVIGDLSIDTKKQDCIQKWRTVGIDGTGVRSPALSGRKSWPHGVTRDVGKECLARDLAFYAD